MKSILYGEYTYWYEILSPADADGDRDTLGFTDFCCKTAAEMRLKQEIRDGKYPQGSVVCRSVGTDAAAGRAGHTASHYDIIDGIGNIGI